MAKQIIHKLVDDLDGGDAEETVKFALDGIQYEIDLSDANAKKLRDVFAPYVAAGGFARRPLGDVAAEFAAVRQATLTLFRYLDAAAWERIGTVEGNPISARALGYIVAGHELHHLVDLRRYRDIVAR